MANGNDWWDEFWQQRAQQNQLRNLLFGAGGVQRNRSVYNPFAQQQQMASIPGVQATMGMVNPTWNYYVNPETGERVLSQGPTGFAAMMDNAMNQMANINNANADRVNALKRTYIQHALPQLIRTQGLLSALGSLGNLAGSGSSRRPRGDYRIDFRANTGARVWG